ncbi:hypothetical protein KBP30_35710 [Streptomyces sp. Go40/10]|uniref:hypothetical protein n=1 Tax=Streptomyces sp. Go40/10 TaxID=2825844 RepID=UPI001E4D53F4|nr:hypothetical protein [Streptomyces sp. Go40/10]UFR07580.1 hypothetical protein KBP30_35710 [Streptomyces sp. Go40/10]
MTRSPSRSGGCGCEVSAGRGRQDGEAEGFAQAVVGARVQAGDDVDVVDAIGTGGEDHDQHVGEAGAQGAGEDQSPGSGGWQDREAELDAGEQWPCRSIMSNRARSERRRKSIGPIPIDAVQFTVPTRGGAAR